MKRCSGTPVAALIALLSIPALMGAQGQPPKHSHYVLKVLDTLGGPHSQVNFNSVVMNARGTVAGGASTAIPDPICTFDYPFCFYFHAVKWQDGVLTNLGTLPGGNNSFAIGINSHGTAVGGSENGLVDPAFGPQLIATLWRTDGQTVDLGTFGGVLSLAVDINDRGDVAVSAANTIPDPDHLVEALVGFPSPTHVHAALWSGGVLQDLGTVGDGPDSFALFVNESGQVAGFGYTNAVPNPETGLPTIGPFLWDSGQMIDLGSLGGVFGGVSGLNKRGQVAGSSNVTRDGSIDHAFLWERGSLLDLGTLGGSFSNAFWIDDSGEVVGAATTPDNLTLRAARWKNGSVTNLGSLNDDVCSLAFGSNSKGQIVGNSVRCDGDGVSTAFLWEHGEMVDLNSLIPTNAGVRLAEGVFINESGEIAGVAELPNGDVHAFVLIPGGGNADENVPSTTTTSTQVPVAPHKGLTAETMAGLRARFANGHRRLGIQPSQSTH